MSVRKLLFTFLLYGMPAVAQELTIAAASDLQSALPEVVAAYEKQTGKKVRVVFGSSGNFFAQIQNGAPFDLFFSADVDYAKRLETAGLTQPGSLYIYALGSIVVWDAETPLDLERSGLQALKDPRVKHIAIANPAHAPYGRAAQTALVNAGIWEAVKDKIVMGENISQAVQFVQSGNAQVGIIAGSLVSEKTKGSIWVVPPKLYPKLEQAVVILKSSKLSGDAEEFLAFMKSDATRQIMKRFGFVPPEPKPKPGKATR